MLSKLLVTIGIVIYALAVPDLEINPSHVFNPEWTSHARLHEVWQLFTNSALGAYALWRLWGHDEVKSAAHATLIVTGGFFAAYFFRDTYGGSMVLSDGSEKMLLGINLGVLGFGLVVLFTLFACWMDSRNRKPGSV